MTAIPNTIRRGALYWYRRSRRLPSGNRFRPTVSLRTACPQAARQRAALLTAKFEDLFMRLFGSPARRLSLDSAAIKLIFEKEFELAFDAIEEERAHATMPGYDYRDFPTYVDVHEEVYRYLAETSSSKWEGDAAAFAKRAPHLDPEATELAVDAAAVIRSDLRSRLAPPSQARTRDLRSPRATGTRPRTQFPRRS